MKIYNQIFIYLCRGFLSLSFLAGKIYIDSSVLPNNFRSQNGKTKWSFQFATQFAIDSRLSFLQVVRAAALGSDILINKNRVS